MYAYNSRLIGDKCNVESEEEDSYEDDDSGEGNTVLVGNTKHLPISYDDNDNDEGGEYSDNLDIENDEENNYVVGTDELNYEKCDLDNDNDNIVVEDQFDQLSFTYDEGENIFVGKSAHRIEFLSDSDSSDEFNYQSVGQRVKI